jgi:hypothetical protein
MTHSFQAPDFYRRHGFEQSARRDPLRDRHLASRGLRGNMRPAPRRRRRSPAARALERARPGASSAVRHEPQREARGAQAPDGLAPARDRSSSTYRTPSRSMSTARTFSSMVERPVQTHGRAANPRSLARLHARLPLVAHRDGEVGARGHRRGCCSSADEGAERTVRAGAGSSSRAGLGAARLTMRGLVRGRAWV